ncbi:MAG: hypothetical protein HY053_07810 [Proteobacteria bacterium]|nr:hypothetical protein [Pseudomonadota bacterium]
MSLVPPLGELIAMAGRVAAQRRPEGANLPEADSGQIEVALDGGSELPRGSRGDAGGLRVSPGQRLG